MSVARGISPGLKTVVELQYPNRTSTRPRYYLRRVSGEIGHLTLPSQPKSQYVMLMPAGGYSLTPLFGTSFSLLRNMFRSEVIQSTTGGGALLATNTKDNQNHYPIRGDLIGVTQPTGVGDEQVPATGGNAMSQRQIPANSDWASDSLTADVDVPVDGDLTPDINVVIPLIGIKTYPENTGFVIRFGTPKSVNPYEKLIRLFFGGQVASLPAGQPAGQWALDMGGNGRYRVFEKGSTWLNSRKVLEGDWTRAGAVNSHVHVVGIIPYSSERLVVHSNVSVEDVDATMAIVAALEQLRSDQDGAYVESQADSGHLHGGGMSGAGHLTMQMRSDYRHPFAVSPVLYPATGTYVDAPFTVDRDLPVNTVITVTGVVHALRDSHITIALYEFGTNTPLTPGVLPNTFYSLAGVRSYYAIFTFTATTDKYSSPILLSYDVTIDNQLTQWNPTPITFTPQKIEITGPDQTPDHETASYSVRDPGNRLDILRTQSRVWTNVKLVDPDTGVTISNVFRGEQARPTSKRMGRKRNAGGSSGMNSAQVFPSEKWRDIEGRMLGAWARLADQINVGRYDFRIDPFGAKDPQGKPLPWKVTDIIRQLLWDAGFDNTQAFIPDFYFRLWYSPTFDDVVYSLQPGARYSDVLIKLTKEILGVYLIYDANISINGGDGAWTLLFNPDPNADPLWQFETERPTIITGPKLMSAPGSYGPFKIWIQDGTFHQDIQPPDYNFISVSSVGQLVPGKGGMRMRYTNFLQNYSSINGPAVFDDGSRNPDFLGRVVPLHVVDPYLGGAGSPDQVQAAVDLFIYRLYNFGAHGKLWCRFSAPLNLRLDGNPLQVYKRCPRINDMCTINGFKAVIRSCNPSSENDKMWRMNIQAVFLFQGLLGQK